MATTHKLLTCHITRNTTFNFQAYGSSFHLAAHILNTHIKLGLGKTGVHQESLCLLFRDLLALVELLRLHLHCPSRGCSPLKFCSDLLIEQLAS